MRKYFLGSLLVASTLFQLVVAENICMDLDRQEIVPPPQSFPIADMNMRCGWEQDHFSVEYTTSRKDGLIEEYDYHFANITALENSKALDDYLLDQNDPNYIRNQPFIVADKKSNASFVIALEVQHLHK